jgi:hypothetical protein
MLHNKNIPNRQFDQIELEAIYQFALIMFYFKKDYIDVFALFID